MQRRCKPNARALSPLSDPESQIGSERAAGKARRVLCPAVAERRAAVAAGGKSFVVPPLCDEAPACWDRGRC